MKSAEEIMEILEAYDLTGSFRDAAELAGCSLLHFRKEEEVLLPVLDTTLGADEAAALFARMGQEAHP